MIILLARPAVEARDADTDEVRSWLQHLGLAEHAYLFAAHEIDFEVLLSLEEHDLRDMGIHDTTQRLMLLRGIEVLRTRGSLAAVGRGNRRWDLVNPHLDGLHPQTSIGLRLLPGPLV